MKKGKWFGIIVAFVLVASLVVSLVASACAPAAPEEVAEEVAELEAEIDELEGDLAAKDREITGLEGDIGDLEDEIAALKKPVEAREWRLQLLCTADTNDFRICGTEFSEKVEDVTDGRIAITPYAAGELVSGPDCLDAVGKAVIESAMSCGSYFAGVIPEADIEGGIPMAWTNPQDFGVLWYDLGLVDIVREAYAEQNAYFVDVIMTGSINFWSKRPINTVADLDGLKIRLFGRHLDLMNAMGASAVFIPHEDVYMALQTGTIDASGTSGYIYESMKYYEVCPYFILPGLIYPSTIQLQVNMDEWNALPDDLKELMHVATRWVSYEMQRRSLYDTEQMYARMADLGTTFITLPDEEVAKLRAAALPMLDDCASKNVRSAEMIEILKDYYGM